MESVIFLLRDFREGNGYDNTAPRKLPTAAADKQAVTQHVAKRIRVASSHRENASHPNTANRHWAQRRVPVNGGKE